MHRLSSPNHPGAAKAPLRSCSGWACQQELLPANPTARLEAIPMGERHPRPLTEQQVEAILASIPRKEVRKRQGQLRPLRTNEPLF